MNLRRTLLQHIVTLDVQARVHDQSQAAEDVTCVFNSDAPMELKAGSATWRVTSTLSPSRSDACVLALTFELTAGEVSNASVGFRFTMSAWSRRHHLFMPAAVYGGNRHEVKQSYRSEDLPNVGIAEMIFMTSGVARLELEQKAGRIDLLTSDMTTPGIGFHSPDEGKALLVLTDDRTTLGLTGVRVEETADGKVATISVSAPGVRDLVRQNGWRMPDRGASWRVGDRVTLRCAVHAFEAPRLQDFYDRYFDVRSELRREPIVRHDIPFSATWAMQERKYNEQNWVEKYGYYSVGMRESLPQDWQTGWVGGPNAIYPLLVRGDAVTRKRVARTLDFICDGGVSSSGFVRNSFHEGRWTDQSKVFLRYSADTLYFMLRSFAVLVDREGDASVPGPWRRAARAIADAFCRAWERDGQFGQYASPRRDQTLFGGTCAASTAIGALALASRFFGQDSYLATARASGHFYHERYVLQGVTNGGPGDILQAQDSESCFGLLESYVTLYEATGDVAWLQPARDVAHQAATWVVNYDFKFPPSSTFGRLDMLTTGTVWANVQNKHSAPGICTLSGVSLLKLARATGDWRYLNLLREIAHAIPQYMSRADRPITDRRPGQRWPVLAPGWINERVNMSDWEVRGDPNEEIGVGEVFGGSTWSEAAMLLTTAEVPGIYAQPDTGLLAGIDHLDVRWANGNGGIEITNPTGFDADVSILCESSQDATRVTNGLQLLKRFARVAVAAGETTHWRRS